MNTKEKIVLLGGGGHCGAVIDVIENENKFDIVGIVDKEELYGQTILGYSIFANDNDLIKLVSEYKNFVITVGHVKSNSVRVRLFGQVKNLGGHLPVIQSPRSYVSKHSFIDEGSIIMHHATVGPKARIGKNSIINTGAVVEHDAVIGNHCHVSTGAYVNGDCSVEDHVFIGSGAVVRQGIHVGTKSLIGAGSVIIHTVESNSVYVGNPAILKRPISE
jgi:sugar O-acyltransferase (sialic acid O-acetyltransferase NeuD family)